MKDDTVQVSVRLPADLHAAVEAERARIQATVPRGVRVTLADAVRAVLTRALRTTTDGGS